MVSIPIRLVPAVHRKNVTFNRIDDRNLARMRRREVNEATGEEVPSEHIVKGFDLGGGRYVVVTDDDLAPLAPAKSKEIELETFVPADDIDPVMFDSSYLVLPDKNPKPYSLLASAMAGGGRVAIGRFVMRQKEYLAAIRSDGTHLTLSTLVFPDELIDIGSVEEFDALDQVEVGERELLMAKSLVEALSEPFEPQRYTDEYRIAVEAVIERKAIGAAPPEYAVHTPRTNVVDLASALEASLREAHASRTRHPTGLDAEAVADEPLEVPSKASAKKTTKVAAPTKPAAAKPRVRRSA
jgi:DNA end-binding protein Ku